MMTSIPRTTPGKYVSQVVTAARIKRIIFGIDRRATFRILGLLYLFSILVSYLTLVAPGRSYVRGWLNDVMWLLDIANRVHLGQVPYKDFHLTYGPAVALIPGLGLDLGLNAGAIFGFNSVVVAALVLLAALVAMPRRLTLPSAVLVFVFVCLLIVVPMGEANNYLTISWGTFYNRHGWAALIVILLFYVEPETIKPHDKWVDAFALASLALLEIYTKFTFGAIALGFVAANTFVSRYNRQMSVRSLFLIIVFAASLEITFRFHMAYWHNIMEFLSWVKGGRIGPRAVASILIANCWIILGSLGAAMATRIAGRRSAFDVLYVFGCILSSMLLRAGIGDNSTIGLVALVAVPICLGELARRAEMQGAATERSPTGRAAHLVWGACLFLALMFISNEAANRIIAWGGYFAKVRSTDVHPLPGTPLRLSGFVVPEVGENDLYDLHKGPEAFDPDLTRYRTLLMGGASSLGTIDYMRSIVEGANLLQSVHYKNRSVLTFDMVDPFTFALGMVPTRNGYPLFFVGMGMITSDPSLLPRPAQLVADVDFVMVPLLPYSPDTTKNMMLIYGSYLRQNFKLLKGSPHWELWAREENP
jgi:hypothetical protein